MTEAHFNIKWMSLSRAIRSNVLINSKWDAKITSRGSWRIVGIHISLLLHSQRDVVRWMIVVSSNVRSTNNQKFQKTGEATIDIGNNSIKTVSIMVQTTSTSTSTSNSNNKTSSSPKMMERRRSSTASRRRSSNMSSIDEDLSADFQKLATNDESGNTILTSTDEMEQLEQEFDQHFEGMEDDLDMLGGIRDSLRTDHSKKSHFRKDEEQVSEEFSKQDADEETSTTSAAADEPVAQEWI